MKGKVNRNLFRLVIGSMTLLLFFGTADAKDKGWSKKIDNGGKRFQVLHNFNNEAVLDNETELVWEQAPVNEDRYWGEALAYCFNKEVGERKGWRAPTIEELATLIDPTQTSAPYLPDNHPFTYVDDPTYFNWWSSTTAADNSINAWIGSFYDGEVTTSVKTSPGPDGRDGWNFPVWCVRGGQGHDAY